MKRSHEPPAGRMAERKLRTTINAIASKLSSGRLPNRDFMELVAYQRELRAELQTVSAKNEAARIKRELAKREAEPAEAKS